MAVFTLQFNSSELKMQTLVTVCAPCSVRIGDTPLSGRKVLWLLHGLSDDGSCWMRFSKIENYCEDKGIVAVMPSGGRSMYCDGVLGQNYFTHITEELPRYLELVFGLSRKREDNFICGLSMGGLGAAKMALRLPERYFAMGSLSGVLSLKELIPRFDDEMIAQFPFLLPALENPDTSELSPVNLLDAEKHSDLQMLIACGESDDLLPLNKIFEAKAKALGLPLCCVYEPGAHEWDFWDRNIKRFLDFALEGKRDFD